eukprot:8366063-Pyramimonas_sp.AAC.1
MGRHQDLLKLKAKRVVATPRAVQPERYVLSKRTGVQNIPALFASDWSVVRIYLRFLRLIGPL